VKLVSDFPRDDVLSELLQVLRVRSTIYCYNQLTAPWGFLINARAKDLPALRHLRDADGALHPPDAPSFKGPLASFHIVLSGACWLKVHGVERPIRLGGGDLVMLPRGHAHELSDDLSSKVLPLEDLLAYITDGGRRLQYGGDGPHTELVCGVFVVENQDALPALEILPPIVHLRGHDGRPPAWLEAVLDLLGREIASTSSGSEAVATRLMDFVFAQALRTVKPSGEEVFAAGLPALMDRQIAATLRLIYDQPHHPWTASKLAAHVAMSRSAFAARFRRLTGESPMRYLARYRLARAADLLRTSNATLLDIALQTGYSSDVALSKAFKRQFGLPPGEYRKAGADRSSATQSARQIVEVAP
jgi:AraC-like DNA-binding protein